MYYLCLYVWWGGYLLMCCVIYYVILSYVLRSGVLFITDVGYVFCITYLCITVVRVLYYLCVVFIID